MNHRVLTNIVFNGVVGVGFVMLNIWALDSGLEETFVTLAILYGGVTILGNGLFVGFVKRKQGK